MRAAPAGGGTPGAARPARQAAMQGSGWGAGGDGRQQAARRRHGCRLHPTPAPRVPPTCAVSSAVTKRSSRVAATSRPAAHSFCGSGDGRQQRKQGGQGSGGAQGCCAGARRRLPPGRLRPRCLAVAAWQCRGRRAHLEVAPRAHAQRSMQHRHQRVARLQRQVDAAACRCRWGRGMHAAVEPGSACHCCTRPASVRSALA